MSKAWYCFTGTDSESYTLNKFRLCGSGFEFPNGCNIGYHVCAMYAAYGGVNPDQLSSKIVNYIARFFSQVTDQPDFFLGGGKLFVCTKTT